MLPKRKADFSHVPEDKRLKKDIVDLLASGTIPAERATGLFQNAQASGAKGCEEYAKLHPGEHNKFDRGNHVKRNVLRKALKGNQWPKVYMFQAPIHIPSTGFESTGKIPVLLPHELLDALHQHNPLESGLFDHSLLDPTPLNHLKKACAQLSADMSKVAGLSIWADGVPYNHDRSKSFEVASLQILTSASTAMRFPLACVPKHWMVKNTTWDAIWQVLKWSLQAAASGVWPAFRHDNSAFADGEFHRKKKAGEPLTRAILLQVKGDWSFYKNVLYLPGWNETSSCCWKCNMVPGNLKEVAKSASWRMLASRKDHWQCLQQVKSVSPLFGVPFFHIDLISLDWLHVVDLGVSLDFLGSFFKYLIDQKLTGTVAEKYQHFYSRMQLFYHGHDIKSRLDQFKPSMLLNTSDGSKIKFPKLRAKAGESRALIPFAVLVGRDLLDQKNVLEKQLFESAVALDKCYQQLSIENFNAAELNKQSIRFALFYVSLNEHFDKLGQRYFKVKPKLHMFLEMCFTANTAPSTTWTYRDESWGGEVSDMAANKAGKSNPHALGMSFFRRFFIKHSLPI